MELVGVTMCRTMSIHSSGAIVCVGLQPVIEADEFPANVGKMLFIITMIGVAEDEEAGAVIYREGGSPKASQVAIRFKVGPIAIKPLEIDPMIVQAPGWHRLSVLARNGSASVQEVGFHRFPVIRRNEAWPDDPGKPPSTNQGPDRMRGMT